MDAALAAAIALTVVEPCSNGIGSDAFAIVWADQSLHGWNGSGRAPRGLKREHFGNADQMPMLGWGTVTTPGAVESWVRLSDRFGRLPFKRLFAPAIGFACDGFPVSPKTACAWSRARDVYRDFPDWQAHFVPEGFEPVPGAIFHSHAMEHPAGDFLQDSWLQSQSERIRMDRALDLAPQIFPERGTVCLSAADASGCMVSYIQSNYMGFGSGVVIPGTGIAMQNRGSGFCLTPGHPNEYAPNKRPFHTIIPGFVCRDDAPLFAFGLMGGHMQAQGHLQMVRRIFDLAENPQAASDAPRWHLRTDFKLIFEKDFPVWMIEELRARGHGVAGYAAESAFGGMQGIYSLENGVYCAASDHRKDACAGGV